MRRWGLWLALIATLAACWWVGQSAPESDVVPQRVQVPARRLAQQLALASPGIQLHAAMPVPLAILDAEASPRANLFAAMPAGGSAQPVEVLAPPVNPYTYVGRLHEGDHWAVFLTDGQQQYVCHLGDWFADGWQVTRLDQQVLVLTHAKQHFEIKLDNGVVL